MNLTIDTFAWLELIRGTTAGAVVRTAIEEANETLTPSIVLAEIAGACHRTGFSHDLIARELAAIGEASTIVQIDFGVALAAAGALDELRTISKARKMPLPGLADALILATARVKHARLLTGDPHFRGMPETVWVQQSRS